MEHRTDVGIRCRISENKTRHECIRTRDFDRTHIAPPPTLWPGYPSLISYLAGVCGRGWKLVGGLKDWALRRRKMRLRGAPIVRQSSEERINVQEEGRHERRNCTRIPVSDQIVLTVSAQLSDTIVGPKPALITRNDTVFHHGGLALHDLNAAAAETPALFPTPVFSVMVTLYRTANPFWEIPPVPASGELAMLPLTVTLRRFICPELRIPPARFELLLAIVESYTHSSP